MQGLPDHLAGFDSKAKSDLDRQRLLLQDCQGRWYFLTDLSAYTWDSPVEPDDLCAVISRLSSPWILYHGSDSLIPEYKRGYFGLLVEAADEPQSRSHEFIFAEIKARVGFSHLPTEMNQICQAAYCLAQELNLISCRRPRGESCDRPYRITRSGLSGGSSEPLS